MFQSLVKVKAFLEDYPDGIFVWVHSRKCEYHNNTISMKVTLPHALKWCEEAALQNDGAVPCFIGDREIFLGA